MDVEAVDADVDTRDQQVDNARLLGRKQLVPQWIETFERIADRLEE